MRKLVPILVIALFVALPLAAASAAEHAAAAKTAQQRGEHQKAAELFEKAVALDPKNADYHFLLGMTYGELARQTEGMRQQMSLARKTKAEFEKAVQYDPGHLQARSGLITFYLLAPGFMGGGADKALAQAAEIKRRNSFEGHRAYGRSTE